MRRDRQAPAGGVRTDAIGPLGEPAMGDYLRVLRADLARSLAPEIGSERGRKLLDMATTLLDHLIVRAGASGDAVAARDAALDRLRAALPAADLEESVSGAIHGADASAVGRATVRAALADEQAFLGAIDTLEGGIARETDRGATRPFGAEEIAAYLTSHYGGPIEVERIGGAIGGFSKDVFVLELSGDARPADAIVIRRDLADGPLEGSVADELAVLGVAQAAGIPVAAPLWVERDPAIFGGPTLCLGFVAGAPVTDVRGNIPADRAVASLTALARLIGMLHAIDPVAAGLSGAVAGDSAQPHVLALLDQFEEQWRRRRGAPNIVLAAAFAWMRAHLPQAPIPARIVHGDCSLRNLMFDGDAPTALLDWETWHIGDPAEDLAYVRDEVESFMPWTDFLAAYRAGGGGAISEERLTYWSMWRELRGAITSLSMMDGVAKGHTDLRAIFGGIYYPRILLAKLAGRLEGLLAEPAR